MKPLHKYALEIACFSIDDAMLAAKAGADRIELCHDYLIGGVSVPVPIDFDSAYLQIPVFMMVRPRGGDFIYTDNEFEKMKQTVELSKKTGADGIVFGILSKEKKVDKIRCKILVEIAQGMNLTFHRAFDEAEDPFQALEDIIGCGFHRILTSGHQSKAIEGTKLISELVAKAQSRIIIMPGGGIRSDNIDILIRETGAREFHSAAINHFNGQCNPIEIQQMKEKLRFAEFSQP